MKRIIYSGLDVHKDSISAAFVDNHGEVLLENTFANHWPTVVKQFEKLGKKYTGSTFKVCYEAGPTGYGLARELAKIEGISMIPSAVP